MPGIPPQIACGTHCALCFVHTLKLTCTLLMSEHTTCPSVAISVLRGSAKFIISADWKNPSTPSQFFLDSALHPLLSLCGNWRLAARHRSTNIILLWPIHLRSLRSTSHLGVKLRTCFCASNMRNRFLSPLSKHLEIGLWLVFFPTWIFTVVYWWWSVLLK